EGPVIGGATNGEVASGQSKVGEGLLKRKGNIVEQEVELQRGVLLKGSRARAVVATIEEAEDSLLYKRGLLNAGQEEHSRLEGAKRVGCMHVDGPLRTGPIQ
ncbi:hypothetical protein GOP47_0001067, partial [Adiantum capillus-veneris]